MDSLSQRLAELDLNDPIAICELAYDYRAVNLAKSIELYEQAIELGDTAAINNLAVLYDSEYHDKKKAIELLECVVARDAADSVAKCNLAMLLSEEDDMRDIPRAIKLFEESIACENKDAMFRLAQYYEFGADQDLPKAITLYTRAVECGHHESLQRLSQLYAQKGIPCDATKAIWVLEHAIMFGDKDSRCYIAGIINRLNLTYEEFRSFIQVYTTRNASIDEVFTDILISTVRYYRDHFITYITSQHAAIQEKDNYIAHLEHMPGGPGYEKAREEWNLYRGGM